MATHIHQSNQKKRRNTMSEEKQGNKPALNIFAKVPQADGTSKIGAQLGVAFAHKNGFNIILDANPIPNPHSGRIELIAFTPKDAS